MVVVIRDTLASSKLFKTMAVISLLAAIAQVASVLLLLGAVVSQYFQTRSIFC